VNPARKHLVIDIQWELIGKQAACKHDVTDIFKSARVSSLFDQTVQMLSLEDLLWHVCMHTQSAKHGQRLR